MAAPIDLTYRTLLEPAVNLFGFVAIVVVGVFILGGVLFHVTEYLSK